MMKLADNFRFALAAVAIIWAIHLLNGFLPIDLRSFGLRPRSIDGLWGILTAPFLHANPDIQRALDYHFTWRRACLAGWKHQQHSYRRQWGYLRTYRIFDVYRHFPRRMGRVGVIDRHIFSVWRRIAVAAGGGAGGQLDRPSVWFSLRRSGRPVDQTMVIKSHYIYHAI